MTPRVFDRALLAKRRARAAAAVASLPGIDFLLERVVEDMADRLALVERRFAVALDLMGHTGLVADMLVASGKVDRVVRLERIPELLRGEDVGVIAEEEALPFAEECLDLVASALSLQFVNDLPGCLAQIRRALRPDGLFLAVLAGGSTLTELRQATMAAEIELTGGASPRVAPFADVATLGALMQRAGFALPVVDRDVVTVRYDSPLSLLYELRAMGAGNVLIEREREPMPRQLVMRICEIYVERFAEADGRVPATFEFVSMSGWAPHESQPQPLAPGSARISLAEALKRAPKP